MITPDILSICILVVVTASLIHEEQAFAQNSTAKSANISYDIGFLQNLSSLFAQAIVIGLAIFGSNALLDWYRRPSLSLNRQDFSRVVRIEIPLYTLNIPDFPRELSQVKVPYIVNRVVIKNKDNNAAENCKGVLGINDLMEKICWYVSSERYTMTINSHSEEYLDVCAILDVELQLVYDKLDEHVSQRFGNSRPSSEAKAYVKAIYNRPADIPVIIAPTENGWMDAHLNRRIHPGDATLLITSKNAKKILKQDIRILATPNVEGKIIEWR